MISNLASMIRGAIITGEMFALEDFANENRIKLPKKALQLTIKFKESIWTSDRTEILKFIANNDASKEERKASFRLVRRYLDLSHWSRPVRGKKSIYKEFQEWLNSRVVSSKREYLNI